MILSPKQQAFVEHYLICFNGTEAARRAGYSIRTANEQAARLLAKDSVKVAVARRIGELRATADEVLLRLASHSRANMDDFVVGDYLNLEKARSLGKMHLIKKLKVRTTTISKPEGEDIETHDVEVELYDAQAATVQLGRILGQFVEHVVVHDWRREALAAGMSAEQAADAFDAMIAAFAERLAPAQPAQLDPSAAEPPIDPPPE